MHRPSPSPTWTAAAAIAGLCLLVGGCSSAGGPTMTTTDKPLTYAIAIHGGAGAIPRDGDPARMQAFRDDMTTVLDIGRTILAKGGTSLDAVEAVIRWLEDNPRFNAGKGAVYTSGGGHELDASIMNGQTLACGAVGGVKTVKNPISLARLVMTQTRHVLLAGPGADAFAQQMGVDLVDQKYFDTPERYEQWQKAQTKQGLKLDDGGQSPKDLPGGRFGTVGCVALDSHGNLAAGTSTGGTNNKKPGRIGDSPIIGAGTYADNRTCAVSGTGIGEEYIRHAVAFRIGALMALDDLTLEQAVHQVMHETLKPNTGGVIAVDHAGRIVMMYNTRGMFRAAADSSGRLEVKVWEGE